MTRRSKCRFCGRMILAGSRKGRGPDVFRRHNNRGGKPCAGSWSVVLDEPADKPQPKPPTTTMWAVMKAHKWEALSANGRPLTCPPEGPHRFIPVFDTRKDAVAWMGSDEHVVELTTV